jgi:hypothetical protein
MRIACIIMAHKQPRQIERLIKRFENFSFDFYIHLDKRTDQRPFLYLAEIPKVQFMQQRVAVRWASAGFVHALLLSMKAILSGKQHYDFISVMSGQDYPIKPPGFLYDTLEKNRNKNFLCYEEEGEWWSHAISRIKKYHFTDFGFPGRYRLQFLMNAVLPERKFPLPYVLYGGPRAMCMSLSTDCAKYVVEFVASNKKLRRFIRYTWGSDEFLIPTIILNSGFRESVVNDNFYYIDWSAGGSSPKTFTREDYPALLKTDKLLARKFDMEQDAVILDMLDDLQITSSAT